MRGFCRLVAADGKITENAKAVDLHAGPSFAFSMERRYNPGRGPGLDMFEELIIAGEIGKNLDDTFSPFVQKVLKCHELPGLTGRIE